MFSFGVCVDGANPCATGFVNGSSEETQTAKLEGQHPLPGAGGAAASSAAPPPLLNTSAVEVLKRLPGVTQAGARCGAGRGLAEWVG